MNKHRITKCYTKRIIGLTMYLIGLLLLAVFGVYVGIFFEGYQPGVLILYCIFIMLPASSGLFVYNIPVKITIGENIMYRTMFRKSIIKYEDIDYVEIGDVTPKFMYYLPTKGRIPHDKRYQLGFKFYYKNDDRRSLSIKRKKVISLNKSIDEDIIKEITIACRLNKIKVKRTRHKESIYS